MLHTTSTSPTSIKIPTELKAKIQNLAQIRNCSGHSIMLKALETFVYREEQREALRQEGIAAHEHYQRTGLHLQQEEVETWLAQIMQGKQEPMPKCHI